MEIRYEKCLRDFDYLISYDIATHCGIAIQDLKTEKIIYYTEIDLSKSKELKEVAFWNALENFYNKLLLNNIISSLSKVIAIKEQFVSQMGGSRFTQLNTLLGLSKLQTIWNVYHNINEIWVYDYDGIHPSTHKSWWRKELGLEEVDKIIIQNAVIKKYNLESNYYEKITDNISDAISLFEPFKKVKINNDINDRQKELRKEIKSLKSSKAIEDRYVEIGRLELLKI